MAGSKSQHELTVEIAGRIASSFGGAMGSVNKQMAMLGKFAGGAAKLTAAGMAAAGTAIIGIAAASTEVGKAFESQMSTVAAISGATGEEFAALEAKAKEMGATTQFSATEAGQAMEYMAMAGWKSSDMVDGIAGIMNLAAASGEELASTSDIVTDALTAFGMTASDSGRFADVLAAASSNANTNVAMLGESFKYVAPLAGTLGYSAEDASIALGLMANAGIKGSQAGTSLKTALANMSAPTDKQATAMKKLGISITNSDNSAKDLMSVMRNLRSSIGSVGVELSDAEGNARAYDDIIADLSKTTEGLSQVQQIEAASTIFGKESMAGMLAIINASEKDFNSLTEAIYNSSGAAAEMAAIRLDNLEGDITLLKSGLEGLGIEIYQGMTAPMREAAQTATQYVAQLNAAFQEGGFSGMAEAIGDIASDALLKTADHAPEFIDMAATLIDGFITGIDNNSSKIGASMGRLIVTLGSAIIRLTPRLIATGGNLLVQIARGVIENLPQLGAATKEAVAYLMNAARDALAGYADFLGDDTVKPFEKFIALIPAVAAGFAAFGGLGAVIKKIAGFIGALKNIQKSAPGVKKGMGTVSSSMSSAVKNILGAGAGLALAAAGVWLLSDAAIRIADAGPGAAVALLAMGAGIAAFMVVAANAGSQLNGAVAGLLAFGAAILIAAAGMSLMAFAATQVAAAGTPAIVTLALMEAGIIAFMAVAAAMGPALTEASIGLVAFGAGIVLAAAGMYIMAQAAIQIGEAGTPAQIAMALLAAGILALGAAAGALAPLLLAGAAALAAFGAALAVVSAAAALGGTALLIISAALPELSEYGASGGLAILELGTSMTVFAGEAALAGTGAAAVAVGFGALAVAAAATDLAFAPLAVEMAAVAAAIEVIEASAGTGADGIKSLRESSSGMVTAMGKLALAFAPVVAAVTPFVAAVATADAATAAFLVVVTASAAGLTLMATGATATGAGLRMAVVSISAFKAGAATMGTAAGQASAALSRFAASFAIVSGPMVSFRNSAQTTFTSLRTTVISSTTATVTQFVAGWKSGREQVTAVWRSYQSAFAAAWGGVHSYAVNAAENTAQQIRSAFENMTITVPRPRLPRISTSYTTAGEGDAQVKVPNFSVSYYAAGGIMTTPTLFGMVGGEAGPEGIIPLNPFWDQLDSAVSAAAAENTGGLSLAKQDAAALCGMQSAVGSTNSRAKELYSKITNNNTESVSNDSSTAESSQKIVYSPQITIQGNANKEDIQSALSMSQSEFNRMMDEYNWQNNRLAMNA